MAQLWQPKSAGDTVERRWTVDLPLGDAISTVTATGTGVTATADHEYEDAVITLSGGTNGIDATVLVTVTTAADLTFTDTFYLPIRANTAFRAVTVLDVCKFALRKIEGDGETPASERVAIAIEYLVEMLTHWRLSGVDIGIAGNLTSTDTLDVPDDYIAALKWNLRLQMHNHYGVDLSAMDIQLADETRRAVINRLGVPRTLEMPSALANNVDQVWTLFQ